MWKEHFPTMNLFPMADMSKTRGHKFNVRSKWFRRDLGIFFPHPEGGENMEHAAREVGGGRYSIFKQHLDEHVNHQGIVDYGPSAGKWD